MNSSDVENSFEKLSLKWISSGSNYKEDNCSQPTFMN